ncbi:hypothetical protein NliqN6_5971 [Naganishia liquefaciens]|uniref:Uncharacterized protein n=1 Tax=Naganishia liquefaciens TaxID=104408 RepID=A0A8H3U0J3_9TREE|nr:hypothetical protein NliqN6_5971 [Naganishia liquefaciens]
MVDGGNDTSGSFGSNVSSRTSVAGTAYFIASGLASLARSGLSALGQSVYYRPSWEEVYRNGDLWHMKIDGQCFKHHATFSRDYAPNMPAHWYIQGHVLAHKDNLMGWLILWVENAKGLLELPRDYKKRSIVISGYIDEPSVIEYMKRQVMDVRDVWPPNADIPILQQQNWVSTGGIDNAWANDSFSVEGLCGKGVILCMTSLDLKQQMRLVADEMVKKGKEMASAAKQDV